jgi:hypothetical protein
MREAIGFGKLGDRLPNAWILPCGAAVASSSPSADTEPRRERARQVRSCLEAGDRYVSSKTTSAGQFPEYVQSTIAARPPNPM